MGFFKNLLPNKAVEEKYVRAGATFGDAVSYLYIGECIGFEGLLNKWAEWEEAYAHKGFRTVSLDRFVDLGGHRKPIDDVIGQRREQGEEPIFHAQIYREEYLGKIKPCVDLEKMLKDGEPQFGTYEPPSTEKKKD